MLMTLLDLTWPTVSLDLHSRPSLISKIIIFSKKAYSISQRVVFSIVKMMKIIM